MDKKTVSIKQKFLMIASLRETNHSSQNDIVALYSHTYSGFSKGSVNTIVKIIQDRNLSIAEIEKMADKELGDLVRPKLNTNRNQKVLPDFEMIHDRLSKDKRMTLFFLWRGYCRNCDDPYSYQRFCELYSRWCAAHQKAPIMAFYNEPPARTGT